MRCTPHSVLAVAATLLCSGAAAGSAVAGEYRVFGCSLPDGTPIATDGWRTHAQPIPTLPSGVADPSWSGWVRGCAEPNGSFGIDFSAQTAGSSVRASWQFDPGPELTIAAGTIRRSVANVGPGSVYAGLQANERDSGEWVQLDAMEGPGTIGNPASPDAPANLLAFPLPRPTFGGQAILPRGPARSLVIYATCFPPYPESPPCSGSARYRVTHTDLTLRDDQSPAISVAGGSLLESGAATTRILTGRESVTVVASDAGIGVESLRVQLGDKQVVEAPLTGSTGSACRFAGTGADGRRTSTSVRPCPGSGSGTAVIDTASVPDGRHPLRVTVSDGSGNQATVAESSVLVKNTNVVGPESPPEFRGALNGDSLADIATITAVWPASGRAPSNRPSVQRRCKAPSYRKRHPLPCLGKPAASMLRQRWSASATDVLTGQLLAPRGTAIAGADVVIRTRDAAGTGTAIATVRTDDAGGYRVNVPRLPGAQTVTASWNARAGDTTPGAFVEATLKVTLGTSFSASNLRSGARVRFAGRVAARQLVADGGATVDLQWWDPPTRAWRTFQSVRVRADGRWSTGRRLYERRTYRMRATLADHPRGWFSGRTGTPRTVRIR